MRFVATLLMFAIVAAMIPLAAASPDCCRNGMSCPLAKMQHHGSSRGAKSDCAVRCGISNEAPSVVITIKPLAIITTIAAAPRAPHPDAARLHERDAQPADRSTSPPVPPPRAA